MSFIKILFIINFINFINYVICNRQHPYLGFPEQDTDRDRVIHGEEAPPHSAPYIVSLKHGRNGSHFCGGSILSPTIILTAAHCLQSNIFVVAGLHDRHIEENCQIIAVQEQFQHENYNGGVGPNDIALLKLQKSLQFNEKIQLIHLPQIHEQSAIQGSGQLYGWGKDTPNGGLPAILQTVTTDLLKYDECKKLLPITAPIATTNICSSSRNQTISACNGDSGGPLVVTDDNGKTVQVGIVSWGYMPCGQQNYPSVYTHTGSHLDWIEKKLAAAGATNDQLASKNGF